MGAGSSQRALRAIRVEVQARTVRRCEWKRARDRTGYRSKSPLSAKWGALDRGLRKRSLAMHASFRLVHRAERSTGLAPGRSSIYERVTVAWGLRSTGSRSELVKR